MILDEICNAFEQAERSFVARDPWVDATGLASQISKHEDLCDRQSNALRWLDQLSFKIIEEPSRLSSEDDRNLFPQPRGCCGDLLQCRLLNQRGHIGRSGIADRSAGTRRGRRPCA